MTDHVSYLHNQEVHTGNTDDLTPITEPKGDIGYISLLTDFNFIE